MPERYTITSASNNLELRFNFELTDKYAPRYNASPAQLLPVISAVAPGGFSYFYWGTIPGWSGNKAISSRLLQVNVKDVISKSGVRKILNTQRCLIPADGFYIWKKVGKKSRIPHRVTLKSNAVFTMAGLWEEFEDENDQTHYTFRIIHTEAPDSLEGIEEFVPLILKEEDEKTWLDLNVPEDDIVKLLENTPPALLEHYTVSSKINDPDNDYPELVSKVESMDQHGNYSLFD